MFIGPSKTQLNEQPHNLNYMWCTCLFYALCFALIFSGQAQKTISADPTTIDSNVQLGLIILQSSKIAPANSVLEIQMPDEFSGIDLRDNRPYTTSCINAAVAYSGYTFSISGLFPSGGSILLFCQINNVPSPKTAGRTSNFNIRIVSSTGVTVHSETVEGQTFTPLQMTCSGSVSGLTYVNMLSTAELFFSPVTNPPNDPISTLKIRFTRPWQNEEIVKDSLLAQAYCSSSTHPQAYCSKQVQYIYVSNIDNASQINISLRSVYNPSAVTTVGTITAHTVSASGLQVNFCNFDLSGFEADQIRSTWISISYASDVSISVSLSFTIRRRILSGSIITIKVPADLSFSSSPACEVERASQPSTTGTFDQSTATLTFSPFSSDDVDSIISINCSSVSRPREAVQVGSWNIKFLSPSRELRAEISCCSSMLDPRDTLNLTNIAVSSPYLGSQNVEYVFEFAKNPLLNYLETDSILVTFPSAYDFTSFSGSCSIFSNQIVTVNSTCAASGKTIKIPQFLSGNTTVQTATFSLTIEGINNPVSNPSAQHFVIAVISSSQLIIERNRSGSVTIGNRLIASVTASLSSYETNHHQVAASITFNTNSRLLQGYLIHLKLPADEVGVQVNLLSCVVNTVAQGCWYQKVGHQILIRMSRDSSSNSVIIEVTGLINPPSTRPTEKLELTIHDASDNLLERSDPTGSPSLKMSSVSEFEESHIWHDMPLNNAGTLSLELISRVDITPSYTLEIAYLASEMQIGPSVQCTDTILNRSLTCTVDTQFYTITIQQLTTSAYINLLFLNISDTTVFETPSLNVSLFNKPTTMPYLSLQTGVEVQDVQLQQISYSITSDSYIMSSSANMVIKYTFLTSLNAAVSSMVVTIPEEYQTVYPNNKFTDTTLNGTITLTVTNPDTDLSGLMYLVAYTASDQLVAVSRNNYQFGLICQLPCKQCSASDPSNCTSCYTNSHMPLFYASGSTGSCVQTCPLSYYHNAAQHQCQKCNANCLSCSQTEPTVCRTCPANSYLHLVDHHCYSVCPVGYYSRNSYCEGCPSNCISCISKAHCIDCQSAYYMYNNLCLNECPPATYVDSHQCQPCSINHCIQCTSATNCLKCAYPHYTHLDSCVSSCPPPLLPDLEGGCSACECPSCSTTSVTCTSCSGSSSYLLDNKCYSVCPPGFFPHANKCMDCQFPCLSCSSSSKCLTCPQTYSLLVSNGTHAQCLNTCPFGYISTLSSAYVSVCQVCESTCATCSISTSFCLSCAANFNLHNNTCVSICPSPLHAINQICRTCVDGCLLCELTDPANCTECIADYYLYRSSCIALCPSDTYIDLLNKQCVQCHSLCSACVSNTECHGCIDQYFLLDQFCYSSCPKTPIFYYEYEGNCETCQPQCVACLNSPVQCTACSRAEYLFSNTTFQCTLSCAGTSFRNGSYCVECQPPCSTCDTTYDSCSSCLEGLNLYSGNCLQECPEGTYASEQICKTCSSPCLTCEQGQCLSCYSFAFLYQKECVLECPADQPFPARGYCTNCSGTDFCALCGSADSSCSVCVYPYLLFEGQCLNECPQIYAADIEERVCFQSDQYQDYLRQVEVFNTPILPPFFFALLYLLVSSVCFLLTRIMYPYTYHIGYLLALLVVTDISCVYYLLYYVVTRYSGEFVPVMPQLPLVLIITSLILNSGLLVAAYGFAVLGAVYLPDVRYLEYRRNHWLYWWGFVTVGMPLLGGHRLHKLNYSKLFGLKIFAYRILSVSKFYREDVLTFCCLVGDACYLAAVFICVYNIFVNYSALFLLGYECLILKVLLWVLSLADLRKPDRGFFMGDEQQAELEIMKELEEEEERKLNRVDTESLAKLIRTKSSAQLRTDKLFEVVEEDLMSVYNPEDYEDVPKVPLRKIEKNIYKGTFRKGNRITVEQRLKKFIDSRKPLPKTKVDAYLKNRLYWRPPKKILVSPDEQCKPSEESMLELLNHKELEYKEEIDEAELQEGINQDQDLERRGHRPSFDLTIPSDTVEFFYPARPTDITPYRDTSLDYDDLMNINYARKKHLVKKSKEAKQEATRVSRHPQQKRGNP